MNTPLADYHRAVIERLVGPALAAVDGAAALSAYCDYRRQFDWLRRTFEQLTETNSMTEDAD